MVREGLECFLQEPEVEQRRFAARPSNPKPPTRRKDHNKYDPTLARIQVVNRWDKTAKILVQL